MLKQQTQNTPYIGVFKTGSGEEFIAKVTEETMLAFMVTKPLCMVPTEKGMQFAPFMFMASPDGNITLPKPMIHALPHKDLAAQYESVTTGIAIPSKPGIITNA